MIELFIVSITGDKFLSPDNILILIVFDLFKGSSGNLADSLTGDATNRGLLRTFIVFNSIFSNPWSWNDTSLPPALVPETVLVLADIAVYPGVILLIIGYIWLYWTFCDAKIWFPPANASVKKLNCEFPLVLTAGAGPVLNFAPLGISR